MDNNIPINEVTTQAFSILGEGGRIRPADGHACSECTQPFSAVPDYIPQQDPAAMVVLDGIVMGPTHCAYDDCINDLGNARGGVFCPHHEIIYGATCHIRDCTAQKVPPTEACQAHQKEWSKHSQNHSRQNL
ncbi:hypothetical protein BD779DRAFT_1456005, partial [Infundibulicybe gibba]